MTTRRHDADRHSDSVLLRVALPLWMRVGWGIVGAGVSIILIALLTALALGRVTDARVIGAVFYLILVTFFVYSVRFVYPIYLVRPTGIERRVPFGKSTRWAWSDITAVAVSRYRKRTYVTARHGKHFAVFAEVPQHDEFIEMILSRAPHVHRPDIDRPARNARYSWWQVASGVVIALLGYYALTYVIAILHSR